MEVPPAAQKSCLLFPASSGSLFLPALPVSTSSFSSSPAAPVAQSPFAFRLKIPAWNFPRLADWTSSYYTLLRPGFHPSLFLLSSGNLSVEPCISQPCILNKLHKLSHISLRLLLTACLSLQKGALPLPGAPRMLLLAQIPVPPLSLPPLGTPSHLGVKEATGKAPVCHAEQGCDKARLQKHWQVIFFPAVMPDTTLQFSWDLKCNSLCIHYLYPKGKL